MLRPTKADMSPLNIYLTHTNAHLAETSCGKLLYGYYPCDAPPNFGFNIGGTVFDIEPKALNRKNNGDNNCTTIVTGQFGEEFLGARYVGQPFMQGKYIDHHDATRSMGFAVLKDTTGKGA